MGAYLDRLDGVLDMVDSALRKRALYYKATRVRHEYMVSKCDGNETYLPIHILRDLFFSN